MSNYWFISGLTALPISSQAGAYQPNSLYWIRLQLLLLWFLLFLLCFSNGTTLSVSLNVTEGLKVGKQVNYDTNRAQQRSAWAHFTRFHFLCRHTNILLLLSTYTHTLIRKRTCRNSSLLAQWISMTPTSGCYLHCICCCCCSYCELMCFRLVRALFLFMSLSSRELTHWTSYCVYLALERATAVHLIS